MPDEESEHADFGAELGGVMSSGADSDSSPSEGPDSDPGPDTDESPQVDVEYESSDESGTGSEEPSAVGEIPPKSLLGERVAPSSEVVASLADAPFPGPASEMNPVPYAVRRDKSDAERDSVLRLSVHEEVLNTEEEAFRHIEDDLFPGSNVRKTDLREAAYYVAFQHFEEVVEVLYQWGFAYRSERR